MMNSAFFSIVRTSIFFCCIAAAEILPLIDTHCSLLLSPPRDPAEYTAIYLRGQGQHCKSVLKAGGIVTYSYILNKNRIPVISDGVVLLTPLNLDTGSEVESGAAAYAAIMANGKAVAGQILGFRLGGHGDELSNIFPQSLVCKGLWEQFEDKIYSCLTNDPLSTARLSWSFYYSNPSATQPSQITYSALFLGGKKLCSSMKQTFYN